MAVSRLVSYLIILLTIILEESEEECSDTFYIRHTVCYSVRDLYDTDVTLKTMVIVGPSLSEVPKFEQLLQVPFQSAKAIRKLEINAAINNISDDAFTNFVSLETIRLLNNQLDTIRPGIFKNLNLKKLEIMKSGVTTLLPGVFANLSTLKRLRLSRNKLTSIDKNVFNNLQIQVLDLKYNKISQIEKLAFANMPNLEELYIGDNKLSEFNVHEFITKLSSLRTLFLNNNNLTQVTTYMLEGLSNLEILNLRFNSISSIEPRAFIETPKLIILTLNHNSLKVLDRAVLPQAGLPNLKILVLHDNKLMYLSSSFVFRLNALKEISIGGNPWQCSCLDLLLKWLADKNVKLVCDKAYFSGQRPVCVVSSIGTNTCIFSYEEESYELFRSYNNKYGSVDVC